MPIKVIALFGQLRNSCRDIRMAALLTDAGNHASGKHHEMALAGSAGAGLATALDQINAGLGAAMGDSAPVQPK
jgi:hypothetical protein